MIKKTPIHWLIATLMLLAPGCAAPGTSNGSGPGDSGGTTAAEDDTSNQPQDDTSNQPQEDTKIAPLECAPFKASGTISALNGSLLYSGDTVEASAEQITGKDCLTSLDMILHTGGGCAVTIALSAEFGKWKLAGAAFTPDEKCGDNWPAEYQGAFQFDSDQSFAGISGTVENTSNPACTSAELTLSGILSFTTGTQELRLKLDGITLNGDLDTNPSSALECPSEYQPIFCPPVGPYGTQYGDVMEDLTVYDCDMNPVSLHELCGRPAALINLFAAW